MDTQQIRDRITALNTKAYYLLVALSFIFALHPQHPPLSFKLALTLTAIVAVLPVQDYFYSSDSWLNFMRVLKVILLTTALVCTLWWTWFAAKS
jgi:hypothetical protein